MRRIRWGTPLSALLVATLASIVATGGAFARAVDIPPLTALRGNETFTAAKLTADERQQIELELRTQTFDLPPSWEGEMRVRRVSLGHGETGLVLQGTNRSCGATGNCQTFVFRRVGDGPWVNLFERNAPIARSFALLNSESFGIQDFLVTSNQSASSTTYTLYRFTGVYYRASPCRSQAVAGSIDCD